MGTFYLSELIIKQCEKKSCNKNGDNQYNDKSALISDYDFPLIIDDGQVIDGLCFLFYLVLSRKTGNLKVHIPVMLLSENPHIFLLILVYTVNLISGLV